MKINMTNRNTSLYQKYRPKSFKEIIGQDVVVKTLVNSIRNNRIGHVYVFSGPKGIGKTTIAKIFSKAINCENFHDDICNDCKNCKLINHNQTIDIYELDAASNSSVENIKTILENSKFLPANLKYKVYIIDEAHMLSNSAWNALLKTLEEPPANVVFIFATTESYKIPPTILSRCQQFEFSRINPKQIQDLLIYVSKNEKIKISQDATKAIINLSEGSARDSLSILEQLSLYSNNDIKDDDVYKIFGLLNIDEKIDFLNLICQNQIDKIMEKINEYEEKGINFSKLVLDFGNILLDLLIFNQTKSINLLSYLNSENINLLNIKNEKLINLINLIQKTYNDIRKSEDIKFAFEIFVFSMIDIIYQIDVPFQSIPNAKQQSIKKNDDSIKSAKTITYDDIKPLKLDINDVYTLQEVNLTYNIESKPNKIVHATKQSNRSLFDINKIGVQIIANSSSKYKTYAEKIINHLKDLSYTSQDFMYFASSFKLVTASQNGIILFFNDELDVNLLNKNFANVEIQKEIIKIISQPMYIIAGTKAQILKMKEIAISTHDDNLKLEPNLDKIRQKLKDSNELGTIAYEIFGPTN